MQIIHGVAFDPSGTFVVAAQHDALVSIWHVPSAERRFELTGHEGPVRAVACSAADRWVASGSLDGVIALWNLDTGVHQPQFARHAQGVLALAFSPDGRRLASACEDGMVAIWDVSEGNQILALQRPASVMAVTWTSDGRAIVTGSFDRSCCTWDESGAELARITSAWGPVFGVACASDGRLAMACSMAAELVPEDRADAPATIRAEHGMCHAVAFTPDGALVMATGPRIVVVQTDAARRTLVGHSDLVSSVSTPLDGALIASGSEDGTVRIWDLRSPSATPIHTLQSP